MAYTLITISSFPSKQKQQQINQKYNNKSHENAAKHTNNNDKNNANIYLIISINNSLFQVEDRPKSV